MADLDTLRPEVREAVHAIDHGNGVFVDSDDSIGAEKWRIVRAELLRLADENARLQYEVESRDMLLGTLNSTIRIWEGRAEKAEAERDALRKRIETAPVVTFERTPTGASWAHAAQTLADIGKKRVRLVVEE